MRCLRSFVLQDHPCYSVTSFHEKFSALRTCMENGEEDGNRGKLIKQFLKAYENHPPAFQKYDITNWNTIKTCQWHSFI